MSLENKLGINGAAELARAEERLGKARAFRLYSSGLLDSLEPGSFKALSTIHRYLFEEVYDFAGCVRTVNIAHPFREGNGRSMRSWLDIMLKKEAGKVVDWNSVDKDDYLLAMERSPIKDTEIKVLLNTALTDAIDDAAVYLKGIDASYHYEGYNLYRTEDLGSWQQLFPEWKLFWTRRWYVPFWNVPRLKIV